MKHRTGYLVAFEGVDGCGKTTLIRACEKLLRLQYANIVITKQPGGSSLGRTLYSTIMQTDGVITPLAKFLLFAADRAQHMHDVIIPALESGALILCDRMSDSSLVYQGYVEGVDTNFIGQVHEYSIGIYKPNLTIFCSISSQDAAKRRAQRNNNDQYDRADDSFFDAVCKGYQRLYTADRDDACVVDALLPLDELARIVVDCITHEIERK
jgi:dTMP kinase